MFWTFLATFVVLVAFMLTLALGTIVGRRKRECSCELAAQIVTAKTSSDRARICPKSRANIRHRPLPGKIG
jgi:hypothetical protein